MTIVILIIAVMGLVGLFFGLVLAIANKKLAVELNPLIHLVEDVLPKGQCGGCGFAGCQAYAEAVVTDPDVAPNLCTPGKEAVAKKVSEITGKKAKDLEERRAFVRCNNPITTAPKKYEYSGIDDCVAMSLLYFGPKSCRYGCIGHGTCAKHCPFNAIEMSETGLPVINKDRCTGCGKCESVCPKKIIEMIPANTIVEVVCSSKDRGAKAKHDCPVACIGCGICAKVCPHGAVKLVDNLPIIDKHVCMKVCTDQICVIKCPTKAIEYIK
ncbi:MAG: Fe-S cluster domain-containing protein [Lachnospiraceae bacterium]|nr:Fe-S cluster domain-containing protein [Lachnospiraceae bacterium]